MAKYLLIIGVVFSGLFLSGQEKSMEMGEKAYETRDYQSAIKHYNKALHQTNDFSTQQQIAGQIARSYFAMNNYSAAARWFEDAIGDRMNNLELGLCYSSALAADKQYAEARSVLNRLLVKNPENKDINQRLLALDLIENAEKGDTLGLIQPLDDLNSLYSDYGVSIWDGMLVFSSTRQANGTTRIDGRTGQGFSNLFTVEPGSEPDQWASPNLMSSAINSQNNDGTFTFDNVHQQGYWTSCTRKPDNCLLYQADYNPVSEKWSKAEKVSFMNEGYNYGHPYMSSDGNTLYFTSNMPAGYGKNDLWKVTRKQKGQWGIPVNLGNKVNSSANEVFPALIGDSILLFASDRITSLGGLDVFFSVNDRLNYIAPVNLGYPINSAADDFSLIVDASGDNAYFCSNRNQEASDNLYHFKGFPIRIKVFGTVINEMDNKPISKATVVFVDDENHVDSVTTDPSGRYEFQANAFNVYRLTAKYPGYYQEKKVINTSARELFSHTIRDVEVDFVLSKTAYPCSISGVIVNRQSHVPMKGVKVEISTKAGFSNYTWSNEQGGYHFTGLKPQTNYTVRTSLIGYFSESRECVLPKVDREQDFNRSNGTDMDFQLLKIQTQSEVVINNIYFDYNLATLREVSRIELNKLASMMRETPGVSIQINAHTDARGRNEYNMELSAQRAAAVVNYLVDQGVSRNRLIAKGWGENQLLIPKANSEDEHQANRRTTFNIIQLNDESPEDLTKAELMSQDELTEADIEYRVQVLTSGESIDVAREFAVVLANLQPIQIFTRQDGSVTKYEAGSRSTLSEISLIKGKLKSMGFRDCFVVCYYKGQRISLDEAKRIEKEGIK
ncbi:MAG: carboxypeptidase regulatory-like domain-containing protein [Bacteroidales bacterium]|nr:carboxypeptidase regulatory-like domain-containing protein [Bacteroidales bacterium]